MPQRIAKELIQVKVPPLYWPSAIGMPSTSAPTVTPCMKAATNEPPEKLRSQIQRSRSALVRNSKATPRRISPASMMRSGR